MLRYLLPLIPGIVLFVAFYLSKSGEVNLLLRDFGRVSFLYLVLALAVTPMIVLTKKDSLAPYRRVFGVLTFFMAITHGAVYFDTEYTYQKTFFVLEHFKELDVASWVVAILVMAVLAVTSNNFSVRLLKSSWKKLQSLTYPLFLIVALHVAFASRFDEFYMVTIGALVFLRTLAYLRGKPISMRNVATKTTRYRCVPCGWIYDEKYGDPDGGIAPGTRFEDIPDDWICPVCGVGKSDFVPYEEAYERTDIPAQVMEANLLNPTTLELVIETSEAFPVIPGQYGRMALQDRDGIFYRSYSVVEINDKRLTFCIKLTTGRGGYVLRNLKAGDALAIEGIYGSFVLQKNTNPKVFIATGTGLSPIVNMMRSLPDTRKTLLFGVRDSGSLFYTNLLQNIPKLTSHIFLSQEETPEYRHGRIDCTQFEFPKGAEFYLCGNPAMVEQVTSDLQTRGFDKIYHEIF